MKNYLFTIIKPTRDLKLKLKFCIIENKQEAIYWALSFVFIYEPHELNWEYKELDQCKDQTGL